jgi:hypothetical protein
MKLTKKTAPDATSAFENVRRRPYPARRKNCTPSIRKNASSAVSVTRPVNLMQSKFAKSKKEDPAW